MANQQTAPQSIPSESKADDAESERLCGSDGTSSLRIASPQAAALQPAAIASAASLVLAGCGGESSSPSGSPPVQSSPPPTTPTPSPTPPASSISAEEAAAARFLLTASLNASRGEIDDVLGEGKETWLNKMMALPNAESAEEFYSRLGYDEVDENAYWDRNSLTTQMMWSQLLSGDNPVRKRWALALSEFFVVSANNLPTRWSSIAMGNYWDLLNKFAFGNFRELLEEITLCPAMAIFLDTRGNQKSDPVTGRQPDENYAREVLQLFSIGLWELNQDGSRREMGGVGLPTYEGEDVSGLAKTFTGYDLDFRNVERVFPPGNNSWTVAEPDFVAKPVSANPAYWSSPQTESLHSSAEKRFLGKSIPPGTNANKTLEEALDTIFAHSNVAPFFCEQMIQRLVTSNPSRGYVQRVASMFNDNGSGVRGDLGAVFRAIVLDPEATSDTATMGPNAGKLREPMLRFIQWGRTFGARSDSGTWLIDGLSREYDQISQTPLRPPSVFGFFRPNYTPPQSAIAASALVAPEFQLVNETSVVGYVNFMQDMVAGYGYSARDVQARYEVELELAGDPVALLQHLNLTLTASQLTQATLQTVEAAITEIHLSSADDTDAKLRRVHTAVFLIMVSSDYLIHR